jgi:hypothetical protein
MKYEANVGDWQNLDQRQLFHQSLGSLIVFHPIPESLNQPDGIIYCKIK